ncbi:MAG: 5-formyltetrahydrofolate cyclo-ligase [Rhodospirillaceae bacterium]|nr:5-formyltetrahydrofolate cyclo-ligase [Rhodospirillaceae bacterium]
MVSLAAIQAAKIELRRRALAARNEVFQARGEAAAASLASQVARIKRRSDHVIIAGYWPLGSEIDCRPALHDLHKEGWGIALPVAGARGDRLLFRQWTPGQQLEAGPFGTSHPGPSAPMVEPNILLVPLLAFDMKGNRLGYGAAYYDRTLHALRSTRRVEAWGFAFDEQEVPEVPAEATDQKLDGVITDRRLLRFA